MLQCHRFKQWWRNERRGDTFEDKWGKQDGSPQPSSKSCAPLQRLQTATLTLHDAEVETQGEDVKQKRSEEEIDERRKTMSKTRGTEILTAKLECWTRAACLCSEWHHDRVSAMEACVSPTRVSGCYLCRCVCVCVESRHVEMTCYSISKEPLPYFATIRFKETVLSKSRRLTADKDAGMRFVMAARLSRFEADKKVASAGCYSCMNPLIIWL